jgi:hypothetical protein
MSVYASSLLLYDNLDNSTNYNTAADDYVKCLLLNTIDDPTSGVEACGPHPSERPARWRLLTLNIYQSAIGILCLMIYGLQVRFAVRINSIV